MCDRDRQLIAELIVVHRELRAPTDTLAGAVWRCRELGTEDVPDSGDASSR